MNVGMMGTYDIAQHQVLTAVTAATLALMPLSACHCPHCGTPVLSVPLRIFGVDFVHAFAYCTTAIFVDGFLWGRMDGRHYSS